MDAAESFRKELTIEFVKTYGPERAQEIMSHMDNIMWKYEITEREQALVPEGTAVKTICEEYFACMMVDGVKESSAKNYFYIVREFLQTVARPLTEIATNDVRSWICIIQTKNKATTLFNKERAVFRFFEWCVREDYLQKNPMGKIKIAKAKTEERKPLSKKEAIRLKNACADTRERILLQFLLSTGCRISEATKLKVDDIDIRAGTVQINHAKLDKSRTVYIDDEFELLYDQYMAERTTDSEYFFTTARGGTGMTTHSLRNIFYGICERSGIKRKITPHLTRHTFISNMIRNGANPNIVAAIAGHANINTTCNVYTHIDQYDLDTAYKRCHVA